MDQKLLKYAAEQFGTPLYIFDIAAFCTSFIEMQIHAGEKTGLCYALKANPFLAAEAGRTADRIEICSLGEYKICREAAVPSEKMLISGVVKKKEELEYILTDCGGECLFSIESFQQYSNLAALARMYEKTVSVFLRLTPGNQFGMEKEVIRRLVKSRHLNPEIHIRGLHYFSGTQNKSLNRTEKELTMLDDFLTDLEIHENFKMEELEYGPGLLVPYFQNQEESTGIRPFFNNFHKITGHMNWKGRITLEMGRAFAASCGYYLTGVVDVKNNGDRNYCLVDGGIHQMNYDGQIRGMYVPHMQKIRYQKEADREKQWTVCGSLCTGNDILCVDAPLGDLSCGDILVFEKTGAYSFTEGMALFLSRDLPEVVLYDPAAGWIQARARKEIYRWNMEEKQGWIF